MKIIDILKQSCEMLGLFDQVKLLDAATETTEQETLKDEELNSLINLFRYSIQELCSNYIPIITVEEMVEKSPKYEISLLKNYIRIQGIYKNETPVRYKIINRCIFFEESDKYSIHYETYPEINSMFEEINYLDNFSPDVLVFGLASYYTLSRGRFDEFEMFHNEYVQKAESLRGLKSFKLPQRRWEWKQKKR